MVAKITTKEQETRIVNLYKSGLSKKAIADKLSMSETPIERVLNENRVPRHPLGSWVSGVPKTTNEKQEQMIVGKYNSGLSKMSISLDMKLGIMVIERVLKDWKVEMRSSGGVRPYNVNSNCLDDLRDERAAYWLGFMFAELSIERSNIAISLSAKDIDHLICWKHFLGCEKEIALFNVGIYRVAKLAISDRLLADRIRSLGIEPHRPRGVELLKSFPETSLNHFLRGWFDGDGSAYKFPQLSFAARPPFLMEVQRVFIENAHANPVTLKRGTGNIIRNLNYRGINRCSEIANYLYRDATTWMPRKRNRILSWPAPKYERSDRFWG